MPAPRREPGCQGADTGEEEEGGGDPESETGGQSGTIESNNVTDPYRGFIDYAT